MQHVKSEFVSRCKDIRDYIRFIKYAENCVNNNMKNHDKKNAFINEGLNKILIANVFLLLYNAIEATVRNAIEALYDEIEDSNSIYENLTKSLKQKWIDDQIQNLKEGTSSIDTLRNKLTEVTNLIIQNQSINLNKKNLGISGNLDAQAIRNISKKHGIEAPKNGRKLEEIKNKRNYLAHGNRSFKEIGGDISHKEVLIYGKETFLFLKEFIKHVSKYIENKDYLVKLEHQTVTNKN